MLAVLLLLFTSAASKAIAEKKSTASDVLAKVNGVEITKTSLDQELAVILPQLVRISFPDLYRLSFDNFGYLLRNLLCVAVFCVINYNSFHI